MRDTKCIESNYIQNNYLGVAVKDKNESINSKIYEDANKIYSIEAEYAINSATNITKNQDFDEFLEALYFKGCNLMYQEKPKSVIKIGEKLLGYSFGINENSHRIKAFNLIGIGHFQMCHYSEAKKNYFEGLSIAQNDKNLRMEAIISLNICDLYERINQPDKSKEYALACMKLCEKIKYNRLKFKASVCYVNLLIKDGEILIANEMLKKSEELMDESITNLDKLYYSLAKGKLLLSNREYDVAESHLLEAMEIALDIKMKKLIILCCQSLVCLYKTTDNQVEALKFGEMSYKYSNELRNQFFICLSLETLGELYENYNKYELSSKYFKDAFKYTKNIVRNCSDIELNKEEKWISKETSTKTSEIRYSNQQMAFENATLKQHIQTVDKINKMLLELRNKSSIEQALICGFKCIQLCANIKSLGFICLSKNFDDQTIKYKYSSNNGLEITDMTVKQKLILLNQLNQSVKKRFKNNFDLFQEIFIQNGKIMYVNKHDHDRVILFKLEPLDPVDDFIINREHINYIIASIKASLYSIGDFSVQMDNGKSHKSQYLSDLKNTFSLTDKLPVIK